MPTPVYYASSLANADQVSALATKLGAYAVATPTYPWWRHGSVQDQGYAGIREVSLKEARGVRDAKAVVAILPGGRGTHVEIGIAIGLRKPVLVLAEDPARFKDGGYTCAFYCHPRVTMTASPISSYHEVIRDWLKTCRLKR